MATRTESESTQALRTAVLYAVNAPSVHNTQPWHFVLRADALDVYADRTRQLGVLDPTGRQLHLSVGCAVLNARVSLAAKRIGVAVRYFPDAERPDLVARFTVDHGATIDPELARLEPSILRRETNRRQFADDVVPAEVLLNLADAAAHEGARLVIVRDDEDRQAVARLTQHADAQQIADPAYRAELRSWTNGTDSRRDGIPARVVPHVDGTAADDVPIRDFDTQGRGWLPATTRSSAKQCLLVLGTDTDEPAAWLQAGQALERVWLEITRAGLVASIFTQPIEVPAIRAELRSELRLTMHPHIVLRVGRAQPTPASPRRLVTDVLVDQSG